METNSNLKKVSEIQWEEDFEKKLVISSEKSEKKIHP